MGKSITDKIMGKTITDKIMDKSITVNHNHRLKIMGTLFFLEAPHFFHPAWMFLFLGCFQPRVFLRVFLTIFYTNFFNRVVQVIKLIIQVKNKFLITAKKFIAFNENNC